MNSCVQKDREGCHRFAEHLQGIVERKQAEPAMTKRAAKHHGKRVSKEERKKLKMQAAAKKAPSSSVKSEAKEVKEPAAQSKSDEPKQIKEYGMKVWKPHHKKSSLLSVGEEYGLIPAEKYGNVMVSPAISLMQTQ